MQFAAQFTRALNQLLSVEMALSMAYHPQMDSQMEQINQELEQFLWLYINHMQMDWADWLPVTEFAYRLTMISHQVVYKFSRLGV
jgi:hypothetical protein